MVGVQDGPNVVFFFHKTCRVYASPRDHPKRSKLLIWSMVTSCHFLNRILMVHFWLFLSVRFLRQILPMLKARTVAPLLGRHISRWCVPCLAHSPLPSDGQTRNSAQSVSKLLAIRLSVSSDISRKFLRINGSWLAISRPQEPPHVQKKIYQWVKWLSRGGITALCSLSFSARVIHVPQSFLIRRLRTRGMLPLKQSEMPEVKPKVKAMPKVKAPWEYSKSVLEFLLDFCWLLLQYSASVWIGYVSGLNLWSRRFRKCQRKEKFWQWCDTW